MLKSEEKIYFPCSPNNTMFVIEAIELAEEKYSKMSAGLEKVMIFVKILKQVMKKIIINNLRRAGATLEGRDIQNNL